MQTKDRIPELDDQAPVFRPCNIDVAAASSAEVPMNRGRNLQTTALVVLWSCSGSSSKTTDAAGDGARPADALAAHDSAQPHDTASPDGNGCKTGGGVNTTKVTLDYSFGVNASDCGCTSMAGCDATFFAATQQGVVRYIVGDAFNPTVLVLEMGGGNDVSLAVNDLDTAIPIGQRGLYSNQHALDLTFTAMELMPGGIVDGSYNGVVLNGTSGSTVTLSGTFHSQFP